MMISDGGNPLAEVALALSMAFFSLMILMLFSVTQKPDVAGLAASVEIQSSQAESEKQELEQTLVIYHDGQFLGVDLKAISIEQLGNKPVLLAIDPDANLHDILMVTQQFSDADLQVTTLNQEWKSRLAK
jgi:hypothetical protein